MELEVIMLSKASQTRKDKHLTFFFMYRSSIFIIYFNGFVWGVKIQVIKVDGRCGVEEMP